MSEDRGWKIVERTVTSLQRHHIDPGDVVKVHYRVSESEALELADRLGVNGSLVIPEEKFIETYRFVDGN